MKARITPTLLLVIIAAVATACEVGNTNAAFVIPGPTVPSRVPTLEPYVWDSRDELANWVENDAAKGPLAVDGSGMEAVIKITRADQQWVARGPDFTPAVTGVRTLRLRYRWRPDSSLPATATQTAYLTAYFQTAAPIHSFDPTAQAAASATLQANDDWSTIEFRPDQYTPPIDVTYCYIHSLGANRGVLEIDRIELVR
jgi:hypothetical protein